jgi:hypothetical protein
MASPLAKTVKSSSRIKGYRPYQDDLFNSLFGVPGFQMPAHLFQCHQAK